MSEYLDRPTRTKEEALEDIRKDQAKALLAIVNRILKVADEI